MERGGNERQARDEPNNSAVWEQLEAIFQEMDSEGEDNVDESLREPLTHLRRLLHLHHETQRKERALYRERQQLEDRRLERKTKLDALVSLLERQRNGEESRLAHRHARRFAPFSLERMGDLWWSWLLAGSGKRFTPLTREG